MASDCDQRVASELCRQPPATGMGQQAMGSGHSAASTTALAFSYVRPLIPSAAATLSRRVPTARVFWVAGAGAALGEAPPGADLKSSVGWPVAGLRLCEGSPGRARSGLGSRHPNHSASRSQELMIESQTFAFVTSGESHRQKVWRKNLSQSSARSPGLRPKRLQPPATRYRHQNAIAHSSSGVSHFGWRGGWTWGSSSKRDLGSDAVKNNRR